MTVKMMIMKYDYGWVYFMSTDPHRISKVMPKLFAMGQAIAFAKEIGIDTEIITKEHWENLMGEHKIFEMVNFVKEGF